MSQGKSTVATTVIDEKLKQYSELQNGKNPPDQKSLLLTNSMN